ncbi:MAG: RDD family protein [Bacillota bacterium]
MSTNGYDENKSEVKEDAKLIGQEEKDHGQETIQEKEPQPLVANAISALRYAGFWMRFWAYLLDLVVIGSINRLLLYPVFRAFDLSLVETSMFAPIAILTTLTFYLYFVLMTKFLGQTLGKMAFGIKVIPLKGDSISWGTVLFREWIGRFISSAILILYIVVAFLPKKQGLHDLFADTTVIHER